MRYHWPLARSDIILFGCSRLISYGFRLIECMKRWFIAGIYLAFYSPRAFRRAVSHTMILIPRQGRYFDTFILLSAQMLGNVSGDMQQVRPVHERELMFICYYYADQPLRQLWILMICHEYAHNTVDTIFIRIYGDYCHRNHSTFRAR